MLRRLFRLTTQLAATGILVACFSIPARAEYYEEIFSCNSSYFDTLFDCRSNPLYPSNPDENQCRYNSGSAYVDCLNAVQDVRPEYDFCTDARQANDDCISLYGPNSGNEDLGALMTCRSASGIDECQ